MVGDLIYGDKVGAITIPEAALDDLAKKAAELHQREHAQIAWLQSKDFSLAAFLKRQGLA